MDFEKKIKQLDKLVEWAEGVVELTPPFDSGKNLLYIAGMAEKYDIEPFVVSKDKMCVFFKAKSKES